MSLFFDFGSNWKNFSANRLGEDRVRAAETSLLENIGAERLAGRSFLDVGCGSGLFSIAAARVGAQPVCGFDINQTGIETSIQNAGRFLTNGAPPPDFIRGSVLDAQFLSTLGTFDTVYAWGSLHHTGRMWDAIRYTADLVKPGGHFVLAIYNPHWSSPAWKQIKRLYNVSPAFAQKSMTALFGVAIYGAVLLTTRRSPFTKERGMDFWYDVIDWLGGYPYEVASISQLEEFLKPSGFRLLHVVRPRVPTGCNELLFERISSTAPA